MRIRVDLKEPMEGLEAMATVTKAHVQLCHSNSSSVSLAANTTWMREVETVHNYTTYQAQNALIEIGDPDLEVPLPQTPGIKKAKLMSRESVLNTTIRAAIPSLLELVDGEQMTRGQDNEADSLVTDLKKKVDHEYADIASQLEMIALSGDNTAEEQAAVRATMVFQAEQGSRVREIHATLVRKMPAPGAVLRPPNPAGLGAAQGLGAEGGAGQE